VPDKDVAITNTISVDAAPDCRLKHLGADHCHGNGKAVLDLRPDRPPDSGRPTSINIMKGLAMSARERLVTFALPLTIIVGACGGSPGPMTPAAAMVTASRSKTNSSSEEADRCRRQWSGTFRHQLRDPPTGRTNALVDLLDSEDPSFIGCIGRYVPRATQRHTSASRESC
jgi:hypothetical protein